MDSLIEVSFEFILLINIIYIIYLIIIDIIVVSCSGANLDIVIAVGMSMDRPQDWATIMQWTKHIVQKHTISEQATRVSLVSIGSRINVHFKFDTYNTKSRIIDAIDSLGC